MTAGALLSHQARADAEDDDEMPLFTLHFISSLSVNEDAKSWEERRIDAIYVLDLVMASPVYSKYDDRIKVETCMSHSGIGIRRYARSRYQALQARLSMLPWPISNRLPS